MITPENLFGYMGVVIGSSLLLPQTIKSFKSKRVDDLSLGFIALENINIIIWTIYGFITKANPVIIANLVGAIFALPLLYFKLKYSKK